MPSRLASPRPRRKPCHGHNGAVATAATNTPTPLNPLTDLFSVGLSIRDPWLCISFCAPPPLPFVRSDCTSWSVCPAAAQAGDSGATPDGSAGGGHDAPDHQGEGPPAQCQRP
eukprot:2555050-Pleurochrysis_carterae.AAC.1